MTDRQRRTACQRPVFTARFSTYTFESLYTMKVDFLQEPPLEFGAGMHHIDIRFGLMHYGPLDVTSDRAPRRIRIGVVGTPEGTEMLLEWLERCRAEIPARASRQPNLFPRFPGFADDVAFRASLVTANELTRTVPSRLFDALRRGGDANHAITGAVAALLPECRYLSEDQGADVIVCVVPPQIAELMDPDMRGAGSSAVSSGGSTSSDGTSPVQSARGRPHSGRQESEPAAPLDFRDLLKARAMGGERLRAPVQLILPSTIDPSRGRKLRIRPGETRSVQDEATRAWNFHTALYYKAHGRPWRLPRDHSQLATCYVGVSFFASLDRSTVMTSMAQVFDERGDGVVVRGGPIKLSKEDRIPHLTATDASALLQEALARYRETHRTLPARVVVHKTSPFDDAELNGFDAAADAQQISVVDYVSVSRGTDIRLFRYGNYPPLRGTYLRLDAREHLLYTRGSVDFYRTYPGSYVPRAFHFRCDRTESTPKQIARELLALTKMNWNVTQFDGGLPITIEAARRVGRILKYLAPNEQVAPRYSYYM